MSLFDLVQVIASLQPEDETTLQAVRVLLKLQHREEAHTTQTASSSSTKTSRERGIAKTSGASAQPSDPKPPLEKKRKSIPSLIELKELPGSVPPEWLQTVEHFGKEGEREDRELPLESLFRKEWTRHILTTIVSTEKPRGRMDLENILSRISRVEVVDTLPRKLQPCVVGSIQLFIDQSESMEPYYLDQRLLTRELIKLVGKDRVQIIRFSGLPYLGTWLKANEERTTPAPPPGTLVLLLSDLGMTGSLWKLHRPMETEWCSFSKDVQGHGCHLIALVPYVLTRVSSTLRRIMTVIEWSRVTSVVTLKRKARTLSQGYAQPR